MYILNFKKCRLFLIFLSVFSVLFLRTGILVANNDQKPFFFTKNLKIGDVGEDVRALQKLLNSNSETEVSSYGPGSKDNETLIFGALTKKAVIKFQELYSSEVLEPLGFKFGTGFVGIATRLKLNSLLEADYANKNQSESANSSMRSSRSSSSSQSSIRSINSFSSVAKTTSVENSSQAFPSQNPSNPAVRLYTTSEYQIAPGKTLELEGEGFTPTSNTIHFGDNYSVSNLSSDAEGSKISLIVPKDLRLGEYNIWITNNNGTTKRDDLRIFLLITNNPAERPIVSKVSPSPVAYDGEMTLEGSNFTSIGNSIYSSFGNIPSISSSDGKTLKFKISSLSEIHRLKENENLIKGKILDGYLYVENNNGISKTPMIFSVKM